MDKKRPKSNEEELTMKRCPDCKKEIGFSQVYCPHCSAELFRGKRHHHGISWVNSFRVLPISED